MQKEEKTKDKHLDKGALDELNKAAILPSFWEFGKDVSIDNYKEHKYKPRFHLPNNNRDLLHSVKWRFCCNVLPISWFNNIVACTNANLRDRRKLISKHEFLKILHKSLLYAISFNVLGVLVSTGLLTIIDFFVLLFLGLDLERIYIVLKKF